MNRRLSGIQNLMHQECFVRFFFCLYQMEQMTSIAHCPVKNVIEAKVRVHIFVSRWYSKRMLSHKYTRTTQFNVYGDHVDLTERTISGIMFLFFFFTLSFLCDSYSCPILLHLPGLLLKRNAFCCSG